MNWKRIKNRVLGVLGLIGISIAAVIAFQPDVPGVPLPLVQVSAKVWDTTNTYSCVVDGLKVTILPGFRCDLASIPDWRVDDLLDIHRDSPSVRRAALVHDALYASRLVSRARADRILWLICIEDKMNLDKAEAVYRWVQECGWIAWEKHTPEMIKLARMLVKVEQL